VRVVVDTNALVSRPLFPNSVPGQAVRRAVTEQPVLASDATIMELAEVLSRNKFNPYVTIEQRKAFLRLFGRIVEYRPILHVVQACRDAKDDKFLERAVNGAADVIGTGDADLLASDPFRDVRIVTPAGFLAHVHAVGGTGDDPSAGR